ncbi:MAG: SPOR domain-containing protein [Bacteroidia bacterium]|nr:SPOR domain-containing protein [Bacteroidia bacterium]
MAQQINIKKVASLFDEGKYSAVISTLEPAMAKNDRDAKQNYYLGASYIMSGVNTTEGIRRLKYSQVKGFFAESHYFLGLAYQSIYEYELAQQSYEKYLKTSKSHKYDSECQKYIEQCTVAIPLSSKLFKLRVIDKYHVAKDSSLMVYTPSREVGTVARNSAFFEDNIDPNGILYRTERGDAVFFSMTPEGEQYEHLYKMEQLLDGWGEASLLNGLATNANDKMPVMMTDGTTLYFSSDRPGGLGGWDIYRTTYDAENRTFTEPINLGVPFNSPADDYLFVADEFRNRAWFTSNRETSTDSVMVYEVLWDNSVIRSFAQSTDEIRESAALKIDESLSQMRRDAYNASATTLNGMRASAAKQYSVTEQEDKFRFAICDTLVYTQWEHFRSVNAMQEYQKLFDIQHRHDSLQNLMASKRKEFMELKTNEQRNAQIAEVLKIEREVYSLEDQITEQSERVRNIELATIQSLLETGDYIPLSSIKRAPQKVSFDWDDLLVASDYIMYDEAYFVDMKTERAPFYATVFNTAEIEELQKADDLLAWAGIMQIEIVKLQEKVINGESMPFRKDELSTSEIQERINLLNRASLMLHSNALEQKFDIYDDKCEHLTTGPDAISVDYSEVNELRASAERDFSLVENITLADSEDQFAKAGLLKKRGIKTLEVAIHRLSSHVDGSFPLPKREKMGDPLANTINSVVGEAPAKKELTPIAPVEEKSPEEATEKEQSTPEQVETSNKANVAPMEEPKEEAKEEPKSEVKKPAVETKPAAVASGRVFRIQLGVFRNNPDAKKLAKVGEIFTEPIPAKGLVKYFAGSYPTREAATADLDKVHKAGFAGAFVVEFKK